MKTCTLETEPSTRIRRRIVAEYDYRAEDGELLFQVCRYQPKDFRQRKPDGKGGWLWKTSGVRRVPFMLPELIQSVADGRTVYVPEGEKDCLALVGAGFTATCNPGGAGKWQDNYSNSLRGAAVVIIADKDASGRDHAADVANKLQGIADNVKIIEMPDIDGKPVKDAADFFDAGGVAADLDALATSAPLFPCDPDFSSTKPKKTSHTTFRSHPFTSVHIGSHLLHPVSEEWKSMVQASIPTAGSQNHQCLFDLARRLKGIEQRTGNSFELAQLKTMFKRWHELAGEFLRPDRCFDDYYFEFLAALECVRYPAGEAVLVSAWEHAQKAESPPEVAAQIESPDIRCLALLCRELQLRAGKHPFILPVRVVQRLFHHADYVKGWRWLDGLCRLGILRKVKAGNYVKREPSEFRYMLLKPSRQPKPPPKIL